MEAAAAAAVAEADADVGGGGRLGGNNLHWTLGMHLAELVRAVLTHCECITVHEGFVAEFVSAPVQATVRAPLPLTPIRLLLFGTASFHQSTPLKSLALRCTRTLHTGSSRSI